MKHSEAVEHIRALRRVAQRARSITAEQFDGMPAQSEAFAQLQPWLFGPTSILDVALRVEDMIDGGAELRPLDFYNVMTIAAKIEPLINALRVLDGGASFPLPDINWLRGWDPE